MNSLLDHTGRILSDNSDIIIDQNTNIDIDVQQLKSFESEAYDIDKGLASAINQTDDIGELKTIIKLAIQERINADLELNEIEFSVKNAEKRTVEDIRADDFGTIRTLTVDINELSNQYAQAIVQDYECVYCGKITSKPQDIMTDQEVEPASCSNSDCSKRNFEKDDSENIDGQSAIVQDLPESSLNPSDIEIRLFDEYVNEFEAGDRITITVEVQTYEDQNTSRKYPRLKVLHAEKEEEKAEIELTDEDIEKFENIVDNLELLKKSYASHLEGSEIDTARESMLLTLFSGDYGNDCRDTVHSLMVGDPSTGKSDLIEEAKKVAPHYAFSTGLNASRAGISAGLEKSQKLQNEEWTLKAGTMVKGNDGVALIDELDKMNESAVKSLYDPLARQKVKIDKIVSKELKANPATAVASNPKNERWDLNKSIGEQIEFPPALLSRFDLVWTVRDTNKSDESKAEAITSKYTSSSDSDDETLTNEEIRKYIYYAQNNYNPVLTEEAEEFLSQKWKTLRNNIDAVKGITIDTRQLESLITISMTYARIRLSDTVELEDAKKSWDITLKSYDRLGRFGSGDGFDSTTLYSGESTTQSDRKEAIKTKVAEMGEDAKENMIASALADEYEHGEILNEIDNMKESGQIFPLDGHLELSNQIA